MNFLDANEIDASLTKFVCNGADGATGPSGASGPQGATGATGQTGATGAQGPQGNQGPAGTNGANGTNGQNTLVKTTTETAGSNCTTGGVKLEYGLDVNSNGVLDANEINASLTKYVCNGADGATGPSGASGPQGATGATGQTGATGAQGPQGIQGPAGTNGANGTNGQNTLVKTTTETAGANCTDGGIKIEYGLDANSNGVLDANEIDASLTKYVCNGATGATGPQGSTGPQGIQGVTGPSGAQGPAGTNGTNGTNGQNTLVKTTTETSGANCTSGGMKVEYGLDANINGVLDANEINATLTKYVCNGADGATGPSGASGPQGATGQTGATGVQGPQGIQGPAGTNGANGTNGQNALVKTTTETSGANCTMGGMKVEYGLDANSNGVLDANEINATLTKYVCNGADGAVGPQGPQGTTGATGPQGSIGLTGATGATGPQGATGLLSSGSAAGNTPYWDGTNWITNNSNIHNNGGNVGIGSSTPTVKLEVNGAATNTSTYNAGSSATIDFSQSNLAYTSATGTTYTLSNLKDGGAYSLILTSTSITGSAAFTSTGFTFKYMGTSSMTSGKTHIYSFIVAGTVVYVSMATEN